MQPGQSITGINIRLLTAETYHVRGKLTGAVPAGAEPVINIVPKDLDVLVYSDRPNLHPDSTFDLDGVSSGQYVINVLRYGSNVLAHVPVEVGVTNIENLKIPIFPPATIRGSVVLDSDASGASPDLANLRITLLASEGSNYAAIPSTYAHSDGTFVLTDIIPNDYYVTVRGEVKGTYVKGRYASLR